ncbi:MAG TPA: 50S ribosomal protein L11 methyltransferase, partial [Bacillota bacterium]|nr:50S ribosomal protein L11 methyltransferase [Bacillota bacterium]
ENIELLPKFINSIDLGGLVLASGIVEWGEEEFTQEYRKVELQLVQRLQTDEWVTLLFEKRKEVQ